MGCEYRVGMPDSRNQIQRLICNVCARNNLQVSRPEEMLLTPRYVNLTLYMSHQEGEIGAATACFWQNIHCKEEVTSSSSREIQLPARS